MRVSIPCVVKKAVRLDGFDTCKIRKELREHRKHLAACCVEWIVVGAWSVLHGDFLPAFISITTVLRYGLASKKV